MVQGTKTNLLIPIGGLATRFKAVGITTPKPLYEVGGLKLLDWAMLSLDLEQFNIIFVIRDDEPRLEKYLWDNFGQFAKVRVLSGNTRGALETCLAAKDLINNHTPLAIYTLDVYFQPSWDGTVPDGLDGFLLTFNSSHPNYSYSAISDYGLVTRVAEKEVISNNASAGIYWFKSGELFTIWAEDYISRNTIMGEYHIAPLYNKLIYNGYKVGTKPVELLYVMGTPEEADFIESILPIDMPYGLVSDHSGYKTKELCKVVLDEAGMNYKDFGCYDDELCDYSDFVPNACRAIQNKSVRYVLGFCRSGQGVNIAANKERGIRAALVDDTYAATYAVKHNAANFFSIPEILESKELDEILEAIEGNKFEGGRHQGRLMKIRDV